MYPLPRHIEDAFRQSSVLVVEVDLNKIDQTKFQPLLMSKGMYPFDDSLWNHVSPETKTLVSRFCDDNGVPSQVFARVKPWLATVMASMLPMQTSGMSPELGIDQHFLNLARNTMRVEQLETAEGQLRLLADIPENKQEQYLVATLKSAALTQQLVKDFKTAWMTGDANRLDTLVSGSWEGATELQKSMFDDRNPHMADVAEQCLKSNQRCFVVVGAGHLVGQRRCGPAATRPRLQSRTTVLFKLIPRAFRAVPAHSTSKSAVRTGELCPTESTAFNSAR